MLHSKSTWIKEWSWYICRCLSFFHSERERLLEQTACNWCLMWPSKGGGDGGSSFVNSFCQLPVGNRAVFVWEITVISVSSGLKSAWNNGTDCKRHSEPAEDFHLALLCSDTQRSCLLNPYQSIFPCRSFIWKRPFKSVLWDGDVWLLLHFDWKTSLSDRGICGLLVFQNIIFSQMQATYAVNLIFTGSSI